MRRPARSLTVYDGKQIDVVVEEWAGREREIVRHPGACAIVAVDDDGHVYLVRQTREPARRELLELPAGTLEEGEEPLETARRELEEEVGLVGGRWRELATFYSTPGFCDERVHEFLAEGVRAGGARNLDQGEDVEVVRWSADDLASRVGELEDAKTLAGLLL